MRPRLRRKSKSTAYATWDKWDPVGYLDTYFHDIRKDENETLKFLVKGVKKFSRRKKIKALEFGTGPTVIHGLVISPVTAEIHLADYLKKNLSEVNKWLRGDKGAFDWDPFTRRILRLENKPVTQRTVKLRNRDLRNKVKKLLHSDAALNSPLKGVTEKYDLIIMTYCTDSATSSKRVWRRYMRNVFTLLAPGGTILITALHKCKFYTIGNNRFPSANITEEDLRKSLLENEFEPNKFTIEVKEVPESADEGYSGLIFVSAEKHKR